MSHPNLLDIDEASFRREVIEASQHMPVLLDFWAAWCAPCKMLTPILEKLATDLAGKLRICKVNIDEQPNLAAQFAVRSVPTLKLIRHGQVVNEALGAQPEEMLRRMIEPHLERPSDKVRGQALSLHASGESDQAIAMLQEAMQAEPEYYKIHLDLLTVLTESGRFDEARQLLDSLPANIQAEQDVQMILPALEFGRIAGNAPSRDALEKTLEQNPDDHQARYQLSALLVLAEEYGQAMDHLLTIMRKDRGFQDDAARKGLLNIFNLLGNEGPLVSRYRAKLSSLLY